MTKTVHRLSKRRAVIELIFAGSLWGFGFVATEWALVSYQPLELLFYRFLFGFIAGEIIHYFVFRSKTQFDINDLKQAFPAGALLSLMMIPQTVGMVYTTATNSGFLTTLYIVFVPLLNHCFFKVKTSPKLYGFVALALFGAYLLMGGYSGEWNKGDLATLACAVVAALHIIYIGKVSPKITDAVRFNNFQTLFCLVSVLPFLPFQETFNLQWEWGLPVMGILFLAIGSSAIGFIFQIRAQAVLNDTTASMLFLLESPFAFLFGSLLLQERLSTWGLVGALLILISSALTIFYDSREYSKSRN